MYTRRIARPRELRPRHSVENQWDLLAPLGVALRVLSQESRDHRMMLAEKKAAALPPTLTVPMILFFLPSLFAAILTPAIIQIKEWN